MCEGGGCHLTKDAVSQGNFIVNHLLQGRTAEKDIGQWQRWV